MDLTVALITVLVGLLVILIIYQMTYWPRKGIPHVPTIPVIGSKYVSLFFGRTSVADFSEDLYKNFPDAKYFGVTMWNQTIIILKDLDLIRDICIKNFDNAPDHRSFVDERMDPILGKNVFSLKGDRWREVRSALSPSFTASKMKFLFQLVSKVSEDFTQYLLDNPEITKLIETKDAFSRYTNDVIATAAFGINVDSMKHRDNEFFFRGKDATNLSGTKRVLKFFAGITFPRLMRFLGQTYLSKETNKFFINLIHDTVTMRDERGVMRPDMIQLLMRARDSSGIKIDMDDIVAQAFIFFLAGFDTTSTLMSFLCHQLAYHPAVQQKLREEVDEVLEDKEFSYEMLAKLKYMDMVINETLRLYPPATFLDRVCEKPFELPPALENSPGMTTDRGVTFWVNIYSIQRDPKYFPEPENFDPERFNEENKANIEPLSFVPFGIGPRKCIGERFGMMETKLVLARIIHKFTVLPSEKSTEKIEIAKNSLSLTPKGGIWLKLQPRT
ncbi:cytochrome P450 9e2-like [Fopius arisanus]|uniref:Cytochrome P450 9e2-like n=1 Tax=Fopius arisanus TaxID=64838 RepID=A0A9R1SVR7_9HYME|nr:PREDICTED: cytochrome P450 9e2-like [Fopius arisanus]XP_011297980.1 PREDICTED: cytochrome P450 9e2-like [Fopius arisanus]